MIQVLLERGTDGRLLRCTASGHANVAPKGADVVCAAVSILLRTTALALAPDSVEVTAQRPGEFLLKVCETTTTNMMKLCFAGDFLEAGLISLEQEFPHAIKIKSRMEQTVQ